MSRVVTHAIAALLGAAFAALGGALLSAPPSPPPVCLDAPVCPICGDVAPNPVSPAPAPE
jgi:hypothetical protein